MCAFVGCVSVPCRSGWAVQAFTGWLFFRDVVTAGDHRVALFASNTFDFGGGVGVPGSANAVLADNIGGTGWRITEESGGVLVLRIANTGPRYAFFPASSRDFGCDRQVPGLSTRVGVVELYRGVRWVIREASGVLEFRDVVADTRYAFYPGCGNINPNPTNQRSR